jgi:hypothetical protein
MYYQKPKKGEINEMWNKINLITKKDKRGMYDEWGCSDCGFKNKYYGIGTIPPYCPECVKKDVVYGTWGVLNKSTCDHCSSLLVICPKENHPNSKFWYLQRIVNEKLLVCPNGCSEDGKRKIKSAIIKSKKLKLKRKEK